MNDYIKINSRQYWKTIVALFLGSFVTFALLYSVQPLIPVFSEEFNVPPSLSSLTVSLSTGGLAVAMLFMSGLSDTVGRKRIMTIALLGSAGLTVLAACSTGFLPLLLLRFLQGLVLAGFPAIAMAYINEEFDPAAVGLVIGIYVSGNSLGGLGGRLLVSALTDFFSWHVALGLLGIGCIALSLWFYFNLPNSKHFTINKMTFTARMASLQEELSHGRMLALYGTGFAVMGSFIAVYNYIGYSLMAPPYNLSQTIVGCLFLIYLVGTFSSTFMGKMADEKGNAAVLCLGVGIMLAGVLLTLAVNLYLKILGLAILTFGFFGSHSVASSWVGKCAVTGKAQAASLYLLFYYIGSSVIGTIGGEFLLWYGWKGVVILVGAVLAGTFLLALWLWASEQSVGYAKQQH